MWSCEDLPKYNKCDVLHIIVNTCLVINSFHKDKPLLHGSIIKHPKEIYSLYSK